MKALVIGKGGREHAICRSLKLSASVSEVHAIPGNPGMVREALCHKISTSDSEALSDFVKTKNIDLVVIGPEVELAAGLADSLRNVGALVFGPSGEAAQLEASKVFAKDFMKRANVPTAAYQVVRTVDEVKKALPDFTPPYVLKADGLAAGKGVFICESESELLQAAKEIFEERKLGHAGSIALLEQSLKGWELSCLCLTNGREYQKLVLAQDHKRLGNDDTGPNTGGMGVVAPLKIDADLSEKIDREILHPTMQTIASMGMLYRGIIYVGLMITEDGPQVLEYNVRFGDPEAQVILPLIDGDCGEILSEVAKGDLPKLEWKSLFASCVVLAAEGYPDAPVKGVTIEGDVFAETASSYFLHAGTAQNEKNQWVTDGGRVMNAIGIGSSMQESLDNAYTQAKSVEWSKMQVRTDIGKNVL